MLFRIRYYIRIHILYLVRTDVPNWLSPVGRQIATENSVFNYFDLRSSIG